MGSVDTSRFPVGAPEVDYDDSEERAGLAAMQADAQACLERVRNLPIVESLTLAFGVAPILGLFLARLACPIVAGAARGDREVWAVVGDLPFMCFETASVRTPAAALETYCEICQDWAESVLDGGDLSNCYQMPVEPNDEHAEMLLSRIEFIREKMIPLV